MNFLDIFLGLAERIFWSMWISIGFALLFNTPRRALWITGVLGGIGWGIKFILLATLMPEQIVITSFLGACVVGLLAVYFAHRVHTPPIVFTIPAVINMIPGKFGYEFIIGMLKIVMVSKNNEVSFDYFLEVFNSGMKTGLILMALAFGIIFPILFFNTRTAKGKDFDRFIAEKIFFRLGIRKRKKGED